MSESPSESPSESRSDPPRPAARVSALGESTARLGRPDASSHPQIVYHADIAFQAFKLRHQEMSMMQMVHATTGLRHRGASKNSLRQSAHKPHVKPVRAPTVKVMAAGSSYGHMFRVTTFGESHGGGCGCIVDGVPARLKVSLEEIQYELDRRRPGQSRITTPRSETDTAEILSGMAPDGVTTLGTPICVLVRWVSICLCRLFRLCRLCCILRCVESCIVYLLDLS